jgi:cbb3-type cytochrome oxidase subunit 3
MSPEMLAATGVVRGILAAALLVLFLALWVWAYSARRRGMFAAMALLPLEDDAYHTLPLRGKAQ